MIVTPRARHIAYFFQLLRMCVILLFVGLAYGLPRRPCSLLRPGQERPPLRVSGGLPEAEIMKRALPM